MKIDTHEISTMPPQRKTNQQSQGPAGHFDALLEKAMNPQSGQASSVGILQTIQSIAPAAIPMPQCIDHRQTVQRIDECLTIMEAYQGKMADPNATLKDAYPLLQRMEKEAADLLPAMDVLPPGDKLKDILNQLLIASTVEITKFNRGDYI